MPKDSSSLPTNAGELLMLALDVLRIEQRIGATESKTIRRWAKSGVPPKKDEARRHAVHCVVEEALPKPRFKQVFGLPRDHVVAQLSTGLDVALAYFGMPNERQHWLDATIDTVAFIMARTGVRVLKRSPDGVSAAAPRWFFAGIRQAKGANKKGQMRTVSLSVKGKITADHRKRRREAPTLIEKDRYQLDETLRKQLDSMVEGANVHDVSLDNIGRRADNNLYRFEWALEEIMLRLDLNPVILIPLICRLDQGAESLVEICSSDNVDEVFDQVMRGAFFQYAQTTSL